MDVRLAADRRRIAKHSGNRFNRAERVPLRRRLRIRVAEFPKRRRGQYRPDQVRKSFAVTSAPAISRR